jgi:hypothetical protein
MFSGGAGNLGVSAADRAVVEDNLPAGQAAGPHDGVAFPDLAFHVAVDPTQSDTPLQA